MDTIDWSYRLITIKGPRGVGRTSFLLQYAKEKFDYRLRQCLYINLNNFYFQGCGLVDFVEEFVKAGGQVLLIDQAFKLNNWQDEIVCCYHRFPQLRIVYATTTVEAIGQSDNELSRLSHTYYLHGFSFREYINLQTQSAFQPFGLEQIIFNHDEIIKTLLQRVKPWEYFNDYLHHGYYPFFLENHLFTESLLKAMNMMVEVDILFNKQVELKYVPRLNRMLYMLAIEGGGTTNISHLAEAIGTSRATVMNYLKYLEEARLINLVYRPGESYPKKPAAVMLHDTNLIYAVYNPMMSEQFIMETFLINALWRHHIVNKDVREGCYKVDHTTRICVCDRTKRFKQGGDFIRARYNMDVAFEGELPLWLFGFLY